tara:strand:- start:123 stop:326 length:204 start_codon:yes stop_codon:yes gene_type:complete
MNIWVEYWKFEDTRNNNHAQMKEQAYWVEPNPEDIRRRFFDKREDASNFAQRMQEDGHRTRIRTDGI